MIFHGKTTFLTEIPEFCYVFRYQKWPQFNFKSFKKNNFGTLWMGHESWNAHKRKRRHSRLPNHHYFGLVLNLKVPTL